MIHWVIPPDATYWNYILADVVDPYASVIGTAPGVWPPAQSPPSSVSNTKWGYTVNVADAGYGGSATNIANAVADALRSSSPPAFAALNEITSAYESRGLLATVANASGPNYANKWGAYIAYGSQGTGQIYPNFPKSIDAVYANNGRLLPEPYPN